MDLFQETEPLDIRVMKLRAQDSLPSKYLSATSSSLYHSAPERTMRARRLSCFLEVVDRSVAAIRHPPME